MIDGFGWFDIAFEGCIPYIFISFTYLHIWAHMLDIPCTIEYNRFPFYVSFFFKHGWVLSLVVM